MADLVEPLYVNDALTTSKKDIVVSTENKDQVSVQTIINSVTGGGGSCRVYIDTTNAPSELWNVDTYWQNILTFDLVNTGDPLYSKYLTVQDDGTKKVLGAWIRVRIVLGVGTTEADLAIYWAWKAEV